uniref:SWIM-type domain-containing protein n=1 Tax=Tanacetum cinerariifolium TaxID=118510 RepID=A0A699GY75_TANCI|nr:hypothetical protein [Tanacetum cinerariifolium]
MYYTSYYPIKTLGVAIVDPLFVRVIFGIKRIRDFSQIKEEVLEVRTKKVGPKPKKKATKMFSEKFLTMIFNRLLRDDFDDCNDPKTDDQDMIGDQWPVHDPNIKWKFMKPRLGERFEDPQQLKRALAFYALANGYKLYYEVKSPRRLVAKCSKDNQEKKCLFRLWASWMQTVKSFQIKNMIDQHVCSRTFEYGSLITSNWIARNYSKKIMINPIVKVKDIMVIGLDGCFLKTIFKGELLSAIGRDGLTIISDQHKEIIEAAKAVIPLAEHKQCARHIYANFKKKFTGVQDISKEAHKHLTERNPESWSRAYIRIDRSCDAIENGISECFNSLIVEAKRKPIINMLEDIKIGLMERIQRMRENHEKWADVICPNIRKKFKVLKSLHRNWKVVPSGKSRFEVRNGYEGFKVDERLRTCTCRGWQLTGLPCQHGFAAIYFLHRDPEAYVSKWYTKKRFVSSYNHYVDRMNGMDQWPITSYQKPLPLIKRRMSGRPPHKKKIDFSEKDGNRSRISRKGQVNHCTLCGESGHNQRACPSKGLDDSATGVNPPPMSARGGKRSAKGGKTPSVSLRPSSPSVGFEMSTPTSPSPAMRLNDGVYIRGNRPIKAASTKSRGRGLMTVNEKVVKSRGKGDGSKSKMYPDGIRPIGYGISWDPVDGETMLGNNMGLPRAAWPAGLTPKDVRIHAQ